MYKVKVSIINQAKICKSQSTNIIVQLCFQWHLCHPANNKCIEIEVHKIWPLFEAKTNDMRSQFDFK